MTQTDVGTIDYKSEILRKSIHMCSLSIPIIYYYITEELALKILIPLTIFSLFIDLGRYVIPALGKYFEMFFGFLLREHERDSKKKNLSGATYVFIAAVLSLIILPKVFFITGFAVLILSDIAAALVGRRFGKHKFLAKSLEGTSAFFIVGCLVVLFTPKITGEFSEYLIAFVAVGFGAIGENVSYGWADDNLVIPLSIGITMWLLYIVFMPELLVNQTSILVNVFN